MNKVFKTLVLLRLFLLVLIFLGSSYNAVADCDPQTDPFCENPDDEVPLDSGVVFLIIASLAFSVIAIKKSREESAVKTTE